jgi:hypothetical protein
LHFFRTNNAFYKAPEENIQRSHTWKTGRPGNGSPSSYPTIRKLPVQRGTDKTDEVRRKTVPTGARREAFHSIITRKSVTSDYMFFKKKKKKKKRGVRPLCLSSKLATHWPSRESRPFSRTS